MNTDEIITQKANRSKALKTVLHTLAAKWELPEGVGHDSANIGYASKNLLNHYYKEKPVPVKNESEFNFVINRIQPNIVTPGLTPLERIKLSNQYPSDLWYNAFNELLELASSNYTDEATKNLCIHVIQEARPIFSLDKQLQDKINQIFAE